MKTLTGTQENVHFLVDPKNPPRLYVQSEEIFCLETIRADNQFLSRERPHFKDHREVMKVKANPVTGPVYIENAEPGDLLEVHILDIRLGHSGNEGYFTYVPGQGVFANRYAPELFLPDTRFCDVSGPTLRLPIGGREIEIPAEPFIGTISVAMREDVTLSYNAGKTMMGNVDCPSVKKGSVVLMPVNVPGALFSLGDLHAKQGDGELLGCAIESDGVVTLSISVRKQPACYFDWPQVNTESRMGSVCTVPNDIEAAIRGAAYDMVKRMEVDFGLPYMDAYMLAGQCLSVQICQMITGCCTAYATMPRALLAGFSKEG